MNLEQKETRQILRDYFSKSRFDMHTTKSIFRKTKTRLICLIIFLLICEVRINIFWIFLLSLAPIAFRQSLRVLFREKDTPVRDYYLAPTQKSQVK